MSYIDHLQHGDWTRTAPCVYCGCGARLYQGRLPQNNIERAATMQLFDALKRGEKNLTWPNFVDAVTL